MIFQKLKNFKFYATPLYLLQSLFYCSYVAFHYHGESKISKGNKTKKMNNIKTNLNKLFKYIAVGGTFLAPGPSQREATKEFKIDLNNKCVNEIIDKLNKIVDDNLKNKLLEGGARSKK